MVRCYAQTMPGVEEITWREIRDRLSPVKFVGFVFAKDQNGIVVFDYGGDLARLLTLRTAEDVFLLALSEPSVSRGRQDLSQVTEWVEKSEAFGQAMNQLVRYRRFSGLPTYRVISRKYGTHQYRRKDFEQAVWRGLVQRYPKWTAVPDDSDVEVWANLLGSHLLVGLRLSDRTMRHRYEKKVELPASLRPSVAAAMVYLTDPKPDDIFLDPMCGSGTILLERRFAGPYRRLLGGDILPDRVEATQKNLGLLGKRAESRPITVRQWDARNLPLETAAIDKVATNLPFGKQIASREAVKALYPAFLAEMARVLRPGGRLVLLSSEYDLVKAGVREQPALAILTGYSVAMLGQWGRIYIIERTD